MLINQIRDLHAASNGTYGEPRITAELAREGVGVNHKRTARLMRQEGLQGHRPRRRRSLTKPDEGAPPIPDLVGRAFQPQLLDTVWCGDITYIPTGEGWLYLATAPRPPQARGRLRDDPPRARLLDWPTQPVSVEADHAGVLLLAGGLAELDLPGAVAHAKMPGTREIPALNSVLSLLALKMIGRRRVSHVDDVAADPALAAFAGMASLPKATALGSYSYRLERAHDARLLEALAPRMLATGQTDGTDIDLDFHAIMHFGEDVALETHYVPRRSQRTESVLTLFAQDGQTRNLVYANADIHKTTQAGEVMRFVHHWRQSTGANPELLVFDSKVTTGAGLAEIAAEGIRFLTLRQRSPKVIEALEALDDDAWTTVTLDRKGRHRRPQVHEDTVTVRGCDTPLRQIAVRGLGHDHPTLILTNDWDAKPGWLVNRYAKRMTVIDLASRRLLGWSMGDPPRRHPGRRRARDGRRRPRAHDDGRHDLSPRPRLGVHLGCVPDRLPPAGGHPVVVTDRVVSR
jgi:transposase InsO family protein